MPLVRGVNTVLLGDGTTISRTVYSSTLYGNQVLAIRKDNEYHMVAPAGCGGERRNFQIIRQLARAEWIRMGLREP
jgi:hypothetical protein